MSFGITDRYWVDPDPEPDIECQDCDNWERCPCGCEYGWCSANNHFCEEDYSCS